MADIFETEILDAIRDHVVPNAAVIGINAQGETVISETYGNLSISSSQPIRLDTPMWIASSTKLITAISALQLVHHGKLSLSDPVDSLLPELALDKLELLIGFTDNDRIKGIPIIVKPSTRITLEMLLSHSSGLSYDIFNPDLKRLREFRGLPPCRDGTIIGENSRLTTLVCEPGTGWAYSTGLDWAGVMIERVTGSSLEEYFVKNIFAPLGIRDSTLDPIGRDEEWKNRLIGRVIRDRESGKVRDMTSEESMFGLLPFLPGQGGGGGRAYSTAEDYIKILKSLLMDDGVLLPKGSIDVLTRGRLTEKGKQMFAKSLAEEWSEADMGLPKGAWDTIEWDYALGGAVCLTRVAGLQEKGVMFWGGMLNNSWYLDREAGTAGFYGTWVFPAGDSPTAQLAASFRRAVYAKVHASTTTQS